MPRSNSSTPEEIGQDVENHLENFLQSIGIATRSLSPNPTQLAEIEVITEDLRLMNRGEQYGLDASWVVHFSDKGKTFNWYFEAKGHGFTDYKNKPRSKHKPFHIKLVAEKLLKALTLHSKDVHCWCLFAPYISCDEGDLNELRDLAEYLPFKLIIWDKNFLYKYLPSINSDLFSTLYFLEQSAPSADQNLASFLKEIVKTHSHEGLFWNTVQKQYSVIRRSIVNKCKKKIVFDSSTEYVPQEEEIIPRSFSTTYKFIYESDEFVTNTTDLSGATTIEGVKRLFAGALNSSSVSLSSKLKEFFDDDDNPYLQIVLEHRCGGYRNSIPFYEIHSSTNFGSSKDKPAFIKVEEM